MINWKYVCITSMFVSLVLRQISCTKLNDCRDIPTQLSATLGVSFRTNQLPDEFIVKFRNFYRARTRKKFLHAALKKTNISNWLVLPRFNPVTAYPSDFDVLRVANIDNTFPDILMLQSHPAVKGVTPHRSLQRTLKYESDGNATVNQQQAFRHRRLLRTLPRQISTTLQADVLWQRGITGKGVKVAVFDTGLAKNHPHFRCVKERTNWTNEKSLDDGVSHGTFVAGVIASSVDCLGLAPDAELHIFRVFTNSQVSYTSWFLDAFNYAIFRKLNVLNLSIGGPDFLDQPFVDKVLELSANKVIMVSAIGNDGPLYGTLNNPGDQSDVIGIGGINFEDKVAKFSSRGMTTWELPLGYGRLKPDIVTYGSQVKGSNINFGCRSLSGTSVASPVVTGAIALISSGALHNLDLINPSSMKQILMEGAQRLSDNNMFEQGHGKLNLLESMKLLQNYEPKITLSPAYLDFTESYMWPYSSQPLFCSSMPVVVNVTILNGISVIGKILETPAWHSYVDKFGHLLSIAISFSPVLWPWSGWMALHITINENGCDFEGIANGHISVTVQNPNKLDEQVAVNTTVNFPISVHIIPKPPKHKRILWDQFHSLKYPPGYIPRDNLKMKSDPLDWRGDHLHTNFRDLYIHLRNTGYYIEILQTPYICFNASDYGTLLLIDPEEEFFDEEITKLQNDVYDFGLSFIVFADWYNTTVMKKIKFFDENTRQWWIPDTGGANIPALNDLLKPYDIELSDFVAEGHFKLGDHDMYYASGSTIAKFPVNVRTIVIGAELHDQGAEIIKTVNSDRKINYVVPILGLFQTHHNLRKKNWQSNLAEHFSNYEKNTDNHPVFETDHSHEKNPIINKRILLKFESNNKLNYMSQNNESSIYEQKKNSKLFTPLSEGRIALFGDSNCLDSTHVEKTCYWLLDALLEFTMSSHTPALLKKHNRANEFNFNVKTTLPLRLHSSNLHKYSNVLNSRNKFSKIKIKECKRLNWAYPKVVTYAEEIAYGKKEILDFKNGKDSLITNLTDFHHDLHQKTLKSQRLYGSFNKEFDKLSLMAFIIFTSLIIFIFIKWLKKSKLFKSNIFRNKA